MRSFARATSNSTSAPVRAPRRRSKSALWAQLRQALARWSFASISTGTTGGPRHRTAPWARLESHGHGFLRRAVWAQVARCAEGVRTIGARRRSPVAHLFNTFDGKACAHLVG